MALSWRVGHLVSRNSPLTDTSDNQLQAEESVLVCPVCWCWCQLSTNSLVTIKAVLGPELLRCLLYIAFQPPRCCWQSRAGPAACFKSQCCCLLAVSSAQKLPAARFSATGPAHGRVRGAQLESSGGPRRAVPCD